MNPFDYINLTPEAKKDPRLIKKIELLFSPEAKNLAHTFIVGTQKQVFYGSPINMVVNSDLLASIGDWSGETPLATSITLTEDNLSGFIVVWLLMNDLFPWIGEGTYIHQFKDVFIIREWMDYFGYNDKQILDRVDDLINLEYLYHAQDYKNEVNDTIKPLIEKKYNMFIQNCLSDPTSQKGHDSCRVIHDYAVLLGKENKETELMYQYGVDDLPYFFLQRKELNDLEKKWANIGLDYLIRLSKGDYHNLSRNQTNDILKLAKLVGKSRDPVVISLTW